MQTLDKNKCRLCFELFCCECCRLRHEVDDHKIYPNCDVCIYGCFRIQQADQNLLKHVKESHMPVSCLYCNAIYNNIEDIIKEKKCPALQHNHNSPKTPMEPANIAFPNVELDSPDYVELQRKQAFQIGSHFITSTPMQAGRDLELFDKLKIPDVNVSDGTSQGVVNKSIIKKTVSVNSKLEPSSKRVTFGETTEFRSTTDDDLHVKCEADHLVPSNKEDPAPSTSVNPEQEMSPKIGSWSEDSSLWSIYHDCDLIEDDVTSTSSITRESIYLDCDLTGVDSIKEDSIDTQSSSIDAPVSLYDAKALTTTPTELPNQENKENLEEHSKDLQNKNDQSQSRLVNVVMPNAFLPTKIEFQEKANIIASDSIAENPRPVDMFLSKMSASSMTESSLWTSTTRMLRRVVERFSVGEMEGKSALFNKRSFPDSEDLWGFEYSPPLKRFKYTDIKCRRSIRHPTFLRDLSAIAASEVTSWITMVDGALKVRIMCHKATQTDEFLVYGWHPR